MTKAKLLEELFDVEERLKTLKLMRERLIDLAKEQGSFAAGDYVFTVQEHVRRSVRLQEMAEAFGEKLLEKKGLIHEHTVITTKVVKKAA